MGYGANWTSQNWKKSATAQSIAATDSVDQMFKKEADAKYIPFKKDRESRDSELHPRSTSIVIGLDSTGSMGNLAVNTAKQLQVLVGEVYERLPVTDPQFMFAFIDDTDCMKYAPALQTTQFEVDTRIAEQLLDMQFTGFGAGNGHESYTLLWYMCDRHTSIDCYEKRGEKGILITIGDDGFPDKLTKKEIKEVFGDDVERDYTTEELLAKINKKYDVWHICMEQGGSYYKEDYDNIHKILGSHALKISDYKKIPELIVSIIEMHGGKELGSILSSWDGSTAMVLENSLKGVISGIKNGSNEVVKF